MKTSIRSLRGVVATLLGMWSGTAAFATEGGGSIYPNGSETMTAGVVPGPGFYGMVFGEHYSAHRVNDAQGNNLNVPGFSVTANAISARFIWVTPATVFSGTLAWHVILPLVNLQVSANGQSQTKTGVGDMVTGLGLGFHLSEHLHMVTGLDFFLPTGDYNKNDLANIGRNYFAFEPVYVVTWLDPNGFNADLKAGYLINQRNRDTDYRSGQEFHFDYALGWGIGNGLSLGAGGYYYRQMTDDKAAGASVPDSRGGAFAIGPVVRYDPGRGWFVTAKWQYETAVRNRAQGNAVWLKAVFPL